MSKQLLNSHPTSTVYQFLPHTKPLYSILPESRCC